MNLQRGEFYPHPRSFDARSLVMCKQLRSKSYFPIGRSSSPTGGYNLKPGGSSVSGLKAEVKVFLEDISVNIFLICTVVLLSSSAAFFFFLGGWGLFSTRNHKPSFGLSQTFGGLVSSVHFQLWGETQRKEVVDVSETSHL